MPKGLAVFCTFSFLPVIVVFVDVPGEAEVADLDDAAVGAVRHEAVAARQVAVHEVHLLQVAAALRHVHAHIQQVKQRQGLGGVLRGNQLMRGIIKKPKNGYCA